MIIPSPVLWKISTNYVKSSFMASILHPKFWKIIQLRKTNSYIIYDILQSMLSSINRCSRVQSQWLFGSFASFLFLFVHLRFEVFTWITYNLHRYHTCAFAATSTVWAFALWICTFGTIFFLIHAGRNVRTTNYLIRLIPGVETERVIKIRLKFFAFLAIIK